MNGLLGSENELIEDYNQNRYLPSLWTCIDGISLNPQKIFGLRPKKIWGQTRGVSYKRGVS